MTDVPCQGTPPVICWLTCTKSPNQTKDYWRIWCKLLNNTGLYLATILSTVLVWKLHPHSGHIWWLWFMLVKVLGAWTIRPQTCCNCVDNFPSIVYFWVYYQISNYIYFLFSIIWIRFSCWFYITTIHGFLLLA